MKSPSPNKLKITAALTLLTILTWLHTLLPNTLAVDFQSIMSFGEGSTGNTQARLLLGSDGALYGITQNGGGEAGGIFKINADGTGYQSLHGFYWSDSLGAYPQDGLIEGSDGALYGVTQYGGSENFGAVFKINRDGSSYSVLYSFSQNDGQYPSTALTVGSDGAFYGTTQNGGSFNSGTIFRLNQDGTAFSVLHSFKSVEGRNANALIKGSDGLYGTARHGGAFNYGTVFRLNEDGTGFAVLRSFINSDGAYPSSPLTKGSDGILYGTTQYGGSSSEGTIFKLNEDGSGFARIQSFVHNSIGAYPIAGLTEGTDGFLYGTTQNGGTSFWGTLFKVQKDGSNMQILRNFDYSSGASPRTIINGLDGVIFGTTVNGGNSQVGTIFKINQDGSDFSNLFHFSFYGNGAYPRSSLIKGSDGALYGTTVYGGDHTHFGTVYKVREDGTGYTVLHSFDYVSGGRPYAALLKGSDGALYGTTPEGGPFGYGSVFKINEDGSGFTLLHGFDYFNGAFPYSALIKGGDGALYGTANYGGEHGFGTVFKLDDNGGNFTTLHQFDYWNGAYPFAALVKGEDGALYGTTGHGGNFEHYGTVFKLSEGAGDFQMLHSFDYSTGANPYTPLVKGGNGRLYGTTLQGGDFGPGTVFMLDQGGGSLAVLHNFDWTTSGGYPSAGLVHGQDGFFYGAAESGGAFQQGTVFRLDHNGADFEVLHSFSGADGAGPTAALLETLPGTFFGTTQSGGDRALGTVFRIGTSHNQSPIANAGPAQSLFVGNGCVASVTLNASSSTDADGDVLTYSWSEGAAPLGTGLQITVSLAPGIHNITLTVDDGNGGSDGSDVAVTVVNRLPSISAGGEYTIFEGSSIVISAVASDPDGGAIDIAWDLAGDGSFSTHSASIAINGSALDGPASYSIPVRVTDACGATATDTAIIHVVNVAPVISSTSGPTTPLPIAATTAPVSALFTDPGTLDSFTATFDWGDGTTSAGVVSSGVAAGEHTYNGAGVFSVRITITDDDGGTAQTTFQYVVIYDPEGGFVTGGGWINSPAGALVAHPTLTGKADFGFVSKYKKGTTIPEGNTEFQFKAGALNFKSTSYGWLVVSGARAQFKGLGTINGTGEYGFLITAIDGQLAGGGGTDKFRIKIWDKATEAIVYDNQSGSDDTSAPTTALGGGSIVIHNK